MATKADLVRRALETVNVVAAGETPSAEDSSLTGGVVDRMVAGYKADDIVIDTTAIPDQVFESLSDIVAARIALSYELETNEVSRLERNARIANLQVRNLLGPRKGSEPVEANYF